MKVFRLVTLLLLSGFGVMSCSTKESEFDASGVFESKEIIVSSEYAGKIISFNIEEGNFVAKDAICGYIESPTQFGIKNCEIKSTIDGTVILKYAEQGELASVGKPLFKVADLDNMILRIYISSSQLTQIKLGQQIKVFADFGTQSKEYLGVVAWVSPKAEFTPKSVQVKNDRDNLAYAVKINVQNDGFLKIGMYADVQL
ncbi:MAG: HlyD family efflux transporter periplasmic adaptor subunit [Bacteroidales bacterium]|jgi:multidrug efflux pump subunit AcrA (membrane-fusion protein)|nr:HlyD family efflux transporter periplasmic adaptor subunit [Bacteroidales bacterium]